MSIQKIQYAQQEIEVPSGTSVSNLIKSLKNFYPELETMNYEIVEGTLIFSSNQEKGAGRTPQQLFNRIFSQVRNDSPSLYSYHTNPDSEIPEPLSTIPDEDDTGGYFIEGGEFFLGAGVDGGLGQQIPRIVGGDITQEAIADAKNQSITMIGDSLGVGTEPRLKEFDWKKQSHNNAGSRQWSHGTAELDALLQLDNMLTSNQVNENVIMVLGTNRGVDPEEIAEAVDKIRNRNLILVDTASEVPHAAEVASAYLAASEQYANVFYANWSQYANKAWYGGDGVHMSGEGYQKHAEFITQAVYQVMNTDWTAGGGGSFPQPTASVYDKSKANTIAIISQSGWSVQEVDQYRVDAADPPYITGEYLNRWMKENRPAGVLNGHGEGIKLLSDYYGISAGMALAVWMKETQIGKTTCGGKYNFGCKKWTSDSPYPKKWDKGTNWIDPPSIEVGYSDWFKFVRFNYVDDGLVLYRDFLNRYSPTSDSNNHSLFKNIAWGVLKSLGYDIKDTVRKTNYGNSSDPVHTTGFVQQLKQQVANAAQQQTGHSGSGTGTSTGKSGALAYHPINPSKGQITMRWMGYDGHRGIDVIYTDGSSEIYATGDGVVEKVITGCTVGDSGCGGGWGNYVKIKHNNNISTQYAHLSSSSVSVGQAVKAGQVIGMMGNTGNSTGKHLHFEIYIGGERVNPEGQMSFAGYA